MERSTNGKRRKRKRSELPQGVEPNAFALWLKDKELDVEVVAKLLGVTTSAVYGWRRGNRPPSRKMAARIAQLTENEVPASSWD